MTTELVGARTTASAEAAPPPEPEVRWARRGWLAPGYLLLSVVLTWPLAAHITSALPYGTEHESTVPLFNLWTLRWNQDRAGHLFAGYWDAPIFHPTRGAFALSEPQPLTGLVFTPLSWLSGNPVLAVNLVLLGILAANGWAAARLARTLGAAAGPAVLVGVLAQGMPFVATQMGVLQLTVVFPLFLLVDAIVRWASRGGRRPAVEMGLWLAVTFLTCSYYGLFAVVGIGGPALLLARRSWVTRARLVELALAAGLFAVVALPIVVMQARITGDYTRSDDLVRNQSALPADFWHLDPRAHGAGFLPWVSDGASGQDLYPGTALLVLGIAGLVLGARRALGRPWLTFLAVGLGLSRVLALGLNLSFAGWEPYRVLKADVPGFESLRSPFRFAVLTEVFLVAAAAWALDALWRWRPRARPWGVAAAVAFVFAGVLEVGIMPVHLFPVDRSEPRWAVWLDHQPPGPVAFLPFPATNGVASYAPTTRHMLQLLDVGAPTVNGYSGLFPESYDELEIAMRDYPNDRADALLRESGARYLVVSRPWLRHDPIRRPWLVGLYPSRYDDQNVEVFQLGN